MNAASLLFLLLLYSVNGCIFVFTLPCHSFLKMEELGTEEGIARQGNESGKLNSSSQTHPCVSGRLDRNIDFLKAHKMAYRWRQHLRLLSACTGKAFSLALYQSICLSVSYKQRIKAEQVRAACRRLSSVTGHARAQAIMRPASRCSFVSLFFLLVLKKCSRPSPVTAPPLSARAVPWLVHVGVLVPAVSPVQGSRLNKQTRRSNNEKLLNCFKQRVWKTSKEQSVS